MDYYKLIQLILEKGIETSISTFNYTKIGYPNTYLSIHMRKNNYNVKRMVNINDLHYINAIIDEMVKQIELYA